MESIAKFKILKQIFQLIKEFLDGKISNASIYSNAEFLRPSFDINSDILEILIVTSEPDADSFELEITKYIRPITTDNNLNVVVTCVLPDNFLGSREHDSVYLGDYDGQL